MKSFLLLLLSLLVAAYCIFIAYNCGELHKLCDMILKAGPHENSAARISHTFSIILKICFGTAAFTMLLTCIVVVNLFRAPEPFINQIKKNNL